MRRREEGNRHSSSINKSNVGSRGEIAPLQASSCLLSSHRERGTRALLSPFSLQVGTLCSLQLVLHCSSLYTDRSPVAVLLWKLAGLLNPVFPSWVHVLCFKKTLQNATTVGVKAVSLELSSWELLQG